MAVAGDIVDPEKEEEDADPYVLAHALEVNNEGLEAVVVTQERIDRPDKVSMRTACDRLGLQAIDLEAFLGEIGLGQ